MTRRMTSRIDGIRCYSELITLPTLQERYEYLRLKSVVGESTFGSDRFLNQMFYSGSLWKTIRRDVILRDQACELGLPGYTIPDESKIFVHHMNPIDVDDLVDDTEFLTNPEYLICVSKRLHDAIHYGDKLPWGFELQERRPGDTCPWK